MDLYNRSSRVLAAAEGITSKEYLDKYRVSGSAYSVSTNTVTQERVNEAKSQVSDALGSIELPVIEGTDFKKQANLWVKQHISMLKLRVRMYLIN